MTNAKVYKGPKLENIVALVLCGGEKQEKCNNSKSYIKRLLTEFPTHALPHGH